MSLFFTGFTLTLNATAVLQVPTMNMRFQWLEEETLPSDSTSVTASVSPTPSRTPSTSPSPSTLVSTLDPTGVVVAQTRLVLAATVAQALTGVQLFVDYLCGAPVWSFPSGPVGRDTEGCGLHTATEPLDGNPSPKSLRMGLWPVVLLRFPLVSNPSWVLETPGPSTEASFNYWVPGTSVIRLYPSTVRLLSTWEQETLGVAANETVVGVFALGYSPEDLADIARGNPYVVSLFSGDFSVTLNATAVLHVPTMNMRFQWLDEDSLPSDTPSVTPSPTSSVSMTPSVTASVSQTSSPSDSASTSATESLSPSPSSSASASVSPSHTPTPSTSASKVSPSASPAPATFDVTAVYAITRLNDGSFVVSGENQPLPDPFGVLTIYADLSPATVAAYAVEGFGDALVTPRTTRGGGSVVLAAQAGLPHCTPTRDTWWTFTSHGPNGTAALFATCVPLGNSRVSVQVAGDIVATRDAVTAAYATTSGVVDASAWLGPDAHLVPLVGTNPPSAQWWLGKE